MIGNQPNISLKLSRARGHQTGLDQLFNQLTRPRLRTLLEDCYKGVTYVLDEDGYAEAEMQDIIRKRFINGWEPLVETYKVSLPACSCRVHRGDPRTEDLGLDSPQDAFTEANFQLFFSMTVEVLVRPWEKMAMNMKFTEVLFSSALLPVRVLH
jgi:hypothetical protein